MRVIVILSVLLLGVIAGFVFFHDPSVVGAAVECSFNNQACDCGKSVCVCGNDTIRSSECYSNSNL